MPFGHQIRLFYCPLISHTYILHFLEEESFLVSDKFTVHTEVKTWEEANVACIINGGHLAAKTDLTEQLIQNQLGDRSENLWIGEYYTPWIWLKGKIINNNAFIFQMFLY